MAQKYGKRKFEGKFPHYTVKGLIECLFPILSAKPIFQQFAEPTVAISLRNTRPKYQKSIRVNLIAIDRANAAKNAKRANRDRTFSRARNIRSEISISTILSSTFSSCQLKENSAHSKYGGRRRDARTKRNETKRKESRKKGKKNKTH